MNVNAQYSKPDFAYPKTVSKNALASLDKALADGDGKLLVRALIDYSLAEKAVDNDSMQPVLNKIADIATRERDVATRAMLSLLQADIYTSIYQANRWIYDNRKLPANAAGEDYSLWSGEQFRDKLLSLTEEALSHPEVLKSQKISDYKGVITIQDDSKPFYPTLYDFAAWRSIDILKQLSPSQWMFPVGWLCRSDVYVTLPFNYQSPIARRILTLYQQLLNFHKGNAAPFINTDISRIDFVALGVDDPAKEKARLLYELYDAYSASPYSTEALIAIGTDSHRLDIEEFPAETQKFYDAATACLHRYPKYFRAEWLKFCIDNITLKNLNLEYNSTIVPGDTLTITVNNKNVNSARIEIYNVPYNPLTGNSMYNMRKGKAQATLIKTIRLKNDLVAPFFSKTKEKVVLDKAGAYLIVPVIEGKRDNPNLKGERNDNPYGRAFDVIHCTSLNVSTGAYGSDRWAYITNPKTGAPEKGSITVTEILSDKRIKDYLTDSAVVKIKGNGHRVYATKGNDRYAQPCYLPYYYTPEHRDSYMVQGNTDLAIYHPGDTVRWGAVVQHYSTNKPSVVAPGIVVKVLLRDANYEVKDTLIATSDEFGRIEGAFTIAAEGLTGNYSLVFQNPNEKDEWTNYGATAFMVSDYKLPTYELQVTDVLRDYPAKGDVTLKGKAETYSGFPIAGCSVTADLEVSPRFRFWWGNSNGQSFYTTTVLTDDAGEFTVCFPAALLASSPVVDGIFTARLTSTSPTGENRQTDRNFTTGKPYILAANLPSSLDISGNVKLDVTLADLNGKPVNEEIAYKLIDADSAVVAEGHFMSNKPSVDLSKVKSGFYSMTFSTVNPELADSANVSSITFYHPYDKDCPIKDAILWVPVSDYTIKDRVTDILYGTTGERQYIRYAIATDTAIIEQGWLEVEAGMHRFTYRLPDGIDKVRITLATNYDYRYESSDINVVTDASIKRINLAIESFRDKIVPGNEEKWTFTVRDRNGAGVKSAIILDMYAKALDALHPQRLFIAPRGMATTIFYTNYTGFDRLSSNDIIWYNWFKLEKCPAITTPAFDLWGQRWSRDIRIRGYGARPTATGAMFRSLAKSDDAEDAVVEEEMSYDMAAPMVAEHKMAVSVNADAGNSVENVEEEAAEPTAGKPDNFQYRAAETPLAFFRPMLTTDSDGNLSFSFTAPNANTTWQLRALAFTKDLLVTDLAREILSNKPIMVQPNMPRFLRTGDKALVKASIMNNSDSTATVNTVVELFDPFSGAIFTTYNYNSVIEAGKSAVVSTAVNATTDMTALGYRIKSSTDTYADGEQSVIPVLSSIAPVIDTYPFYISPDSTAFEMQLPAMPADASVTLQFCNNPSWYVVTALPGLRKEEAKDALSASAAIFSAAIADGILKSDRNIAEAIKMWNESDRSDSTLVSMLERNSDLKTILLNCTPWVMDAKSDTERMERLALLFDPGMIADTYEKAIRQLAMLEAPRGGWSWIGQVKDPSPWITENIIGMMGKLKRLGFLPANKRLDEMIRRGVEYLDRDAAKTIKEYPQSTDLSYAVIRLDYPEIALPAGAQRMVNNTVAEVNARWKQYGVTEKALAATLLYGHKYRTAARNILASLREYATTTPQKGMWWASLDDMTVWSMGKVAATSLILEAFNTIEPQSPDVEHIRQWLILQKEAKNWGTSVATSDAIAAILLSGKNMTVPVSVPVVKVSDKNVTPDSVDSLLGYFRRDISSLNPSGAMLTVAKQKDIPSWGAVFCRYRNEMSEIKAASCDDVSIEKKLFVKSADGNQTVWLDADTVKVGDVVQVNLTIITKRDMDYVAIIDDRGACFEPVEQLPQPLYAEGICFYRENRDEATNIFVTHLPKGIYRLSYELYVNNAGRYSAGVASLQSQYAPALSAHSAGAIINVEEQ